MTDKELIEQYKILARHQAQRLFTARFQGDWQEVREVARTLFRIGLGLGLFEDDFPTLRKDTLSERVTDLNEYKARNNR